MKIVADSKCLVSGEKMYEKLLFFSNLPYPEHIDGVSIEERYLCNLNDSTKLSFCSPDNIVIIDFKNGSVDCITGIDFETGLEILEPYMRKYKIKKLKSKIL